MFEIGDRVLRIEMRETCGATVVEVRSDEDGNHYRISYDEGGEGYWPENALQPEIL
tara:strand:+ start:175 stop:342 length:168 start_codon:yes stop_codon:yes gene_type:complete